MPEELVCFIPDSFYFAHISCRVETSKNIMTREKMQFGAASAPIQYLLSDFYDAHAHAYNELTDVMYKNMHQFHEH